MGSVRLKVLNGARSDSRRLCDTCSFGLVTRGAADSEEHVYCSWMSRAVTICVVECNRFTSRVDPALEEMEEIAVMLRSDLKRLNVGFGKSRQTTSKS
jgi:hypothetical protein